MFSPTPVPHGLSEKSKGILRRLKNSTRSAGISIGDHLATVASNGGEQEEEDFLAAEAELIADIAIQVAADLRGEPVDGAEPSDLEEEALDEPLGEAELAEIIEEEQGQVSEVVPVQMSTFERGDLDGIIRHLSNMVIGNPLLMEITYEVIGVKSPAQIYVRVSGYLPADWDLAIEDEKTG
jgi:hypothetical protein